MIIQSNLLTKEECDFVLNKFTNFETSSLYEYNTKRINTKYRSSKESTQKISEELYELLIKKLKKFEIVSLPDYIKVLKYEVGGEFKKHTDRGDNNETKHRYKTIIVQLSDEYSYEGGDLVVWDGKDEIFINKNIGNFVMFDSGLEHQAMPVTNGIRYVLVMWLSKNNIVNKLNYLI